MNIGDYVRTKDGFIGKITEISSDEKLHLFLKAIYTDNYKIDMVLEDEIIKSSSNIIDLIEVGDFINGYLVLNVLDFNDNTRSLSLEKIYDSNIVEEDIKSIVTHEMFESMEYKIGE